MSQQEAISSQTYVGRKTKTRITTLDVDTTAKIVLKNNPSRLGVYFANLTSADVAIGFANSVTTTFGFALEALGGIIAWTRLQDGNIPELEIWAIASANNTNVLCVELIEVKEGKIVS